MVSAIQRKEREEKEQEIIEMIARIKEPFKMASRAYKGVDSMVTVEGRSIGNGHFAVIAGPCSVESHSQIIDIAQSIDGSGAKFLRGGAFKPRTSPYDFQGLQGEGLELLRAAKKATGMPFVTEIMSVKQLEDYADIIDVVQIGARNMQNFDLLKAAGKINKPVLLKRGMSATIEEFLMASEYILAGGNHQVILCERGIRTFEKYTRNTLDLSAIPVIKRFSHLPVVIDPSHATGDARYVESMALAAVAAGADGLMIEVHNNPEKAVSDGKQSLTPQAFKELMIKVKQIAEITGKMM
ncbi:3-deoxy-7-phosphoheptulonate synthase [Fusibacter sp. 3D3]|uniref:3-deoxy-7-phosphoheptulonate synthase n=1 Tax=Fusibacter sp. 3D3 TaxID=1048380 RepID=UPI000853A95C|nr:3-deoxy-7-phosphoheptulonate synthase [Fusibacter sp. 3D3]GAU78161.1 2-keto-3-deoxy-D-arabino-heptulosonate-7-phosphate synthase I beta [Fusibacter sp. 3D3]